MSLWRNALLLGIGIMHTLLWDGDVLVVYALCAPVLIAVRRTSPVALMIAGTAAVLWSAVVAAVVQGTVPATGAGLGEFWLTDGGPMSDAIGAFILNDAGARSLGMMLIGVAFYRRMTRYGLGIGLPLAALGVALQAANGFSPTIAVIGEVSNTIATIPATLGYLGLITLWNRRPDSRLCRRLRAVGRMALTNYLTQTVIGIVVLHGMLGTVELHRTDIAVFVGVVWALQLAWSSPWLRAFRFGPFEWAWRSATYARLRSLP